MLARKLHSANTCVLNSDTSLAPVSGGGKPTLRDYMKMMKETNSDASSVYAAMHGGGGGGGTEAATPSGVQSTAPPSMPPYSAPGMGREGSISPAKAATPIASSPSPRPPPGSSPAQPLTGQHPAHPGQPHANWQSSSVPMYPSGQMSHTTV